MERDSEQKLVAGRVTSREQGRLNPSPPYPKVVPGKAPNITNTISSTYPNRPIHLQRYVLLRWGSCGASGGLQVGIAGQDLKCG